MLCSLKNLISQDKGRGGSRGGGNRNQGGDGDMVRIFLNTIACGIKLLHTIVNGFMTMVMW